MRKELFSSGQKIVRQDLDRAQSSKEVALQDRLDDNFNSGVCEGLLNGMAFAVGPTTTSITVQTGVAYNFNGERIYIPDQGVAFNASAVSNTTADGIGGTTVTPASTGSFGVPVTAGVVNLVYIQYIATIDPQVFSLHKITGKKLFTSGGDGYEIRIVNAGNVNPLTVNIVTSAPAGGPWIFLGLVDFRAGAPVVSGMFDITLRPDFTIIKDRVDLAFSDISGTATGSQIAFQTLTVSNLGTNSVGNAQLQAGSVTVDKLGFTLSNGGVIRLSVQGDAEVTGDTPIVKALSDRTGAITSVLFYVDTIPQGTGGQGLEIDIRKNGTAAGNSIFTVRPKILNGATSNAAPGVLYTITTSPAVLPVVGQLSTLSSTISVGDRLSIHVTAIGDSVPGGADMSLAILVA